MTKRKQHWYRKALEYHRNLDRVGCEMWKMIDALIEYISELEKDK